MIGILPYLLRQTQTFPPKLLPADMWGRRPLAAAGSPGRSGMRPRCCRGGLLTPCPPLRYAMADFPTSGSVHCLVPVGRALRICRT